jgi:hypothetical protein
MTAPSQAWLNVGASALAIVETVGRKRRDPHMPSTYVSWRDLDRLADALRELGITVNADNLGAEPRAAIERRNATYREHRTSVTNDRERPGETYRVTCSCGWERFGFEYGLQAGRAGKAHVREQVAAA